MAKQELIVHVHTILSIFQQLDQMSEDGMSPTYTSSTIWSISKEDANDVPPPLPTLSNDYSNACEDVTSLSQSCLEIYSTFCKPQSLSYIYDTISSSYPGSIVRHPKVWRKESILNYLFHVPYPGEGTSFPISKWKRRRNDATTIAIVSGVREYIHSTTSSSDARIHSPVSIPLYSPRLITTAQQPQQQRFIDVIANHYLGWNPNNNNATTASSSQQQIVDRRLLISLQWLSNTIYILPIIISCLARCMEWVSTHPLNYSIPDIHDNREGRNRNVVRHLRYLSTIECGYVCIIFVFSWLVLGRYIERYIGRTMERCLLEQPHTNIHNTIGHVFLKLCDVTCPKLLQTILNITPYWNKRTEQELKNILVKSRHQDLWEYSRYAFHGDYGSGMQIGIGQMLCRPTPNNKSKKMLIVQQGLKIVLAILLSIFSFMICSPWFILNLWIVFYCSISLGMSLSIQSLEITQPQHSSQSTLSPSPLLSNISNLKLHILVNLFILIGQLIGSSGGSIFLAEFVVTSVSLLLGGAATISTNAIESWVCLLSLCMVSFIGFMVSRLGLLYVLKRKRCRGMLFVLVISVLVGLVVGVCILMFWRFELVRTIVIVRDVHGLAGRRRETSSGGSSQRKHAFIPS